MNQAKHPIATMCRLLEVSTSGYYAWRDRRPSRRVEGDVALLARIKAIHAASRRTYGAPRIYAELAAEGICVGRKRIARLMRAAGLAGVSRRKGVHTTQRRRGARPAVGRRHHLQCASSRMVRGAYVRNARRKEERGMP